MHFIVRKKIKRTFECPRCQHVETAVGRVNHRSSRYSLCAAVFQRVLAAFLANCLRFCSGSAAVRALPPFAPSSCPGFTAAGSFFSPALRCTGPALDLPRGDVHDRLSRLGEIPRALGAASLGSTALIVPSLEGFLTGVMLVVFRALVRHVSEYAPSGLGRKRENGLPVKPTHYPVLTGLT